MTTPSSDADALAAALIQLSAHAERLGGLDARETSHHQQLTVSLENLGTQLTAVSTRISEIDTTLARQSAILDSLDGLATQVAAIATQVAALAVDDRGDGGASWYQPVPSPRWWKLTGEEREAALDRLRAWAEQIYRPGYGKLAALLPPCWEHHPACLYILDWLSELWSLLYLDTERDGRTLAGQAEWHIRLLPAAAEQMASEAKGCQHAARGGHRPSPGTPATVNGARPRH
jgi:hypothetical protein